MTREVERLIEQVLKGADPFRLLERILREEDKSKVPSVGEWDINRLMKSRKEMRNESK
jgi:hypothetical protein